MSGDTGGTVYVCEWCGATVAPEDVYDYGGDLAHTAWPIDPYYSSPSAGLPCGRVLARSSWTQS